MKTTVVATLLAVAACAYAAYSPKVDIETRSLDDIYTAAQREDGALQVFWGGDAGFQGDAVRTAWAQRFPNVKLNLTVDLSKYHNGRIDRGHLEGLQVADFANLQTLHDFRRWKAEGKLLSYKPATFEDLLEGEKDLDGAYLPTMIGSFGSMVYDTTKLKQSEVPTDFASFPEPKWRGKLILTYPNDDDAIAYLFSLIVSRYGYQWLYDLAQNEVQWVRGTGTPGLQLAALHNDTSSPRSISFTTYSPGSPFLATKSPEAPEQYMSWTQTGAILKGTRRPESAKLFMSWLLSTERQGSNATMGATPLASVNDGRGVDVYGRNATQVSGFRVFEQDRAGVEWWKNLFEEVLGSAQGKGPLEVYPNVAT